MFFSLGDNGAWYSLELNKTLPRLWVLTDGDLPPIGVLALRLLPDIIGTYISPSSALSFLCLSSSYIETLFVSLDGVLTCCSGFLSWEIPSRSLLLIVFKF